MDREPEKKHRMPPWVPLAAATMSTVGTFGIAHAVSPGFRNGCNTLVNHVTGFFGERMVPTVTLGDIPGLTAELGINKIGDDKQYLTAITLSPDSGISGIDIGKDKVTITYAAAGIPTQSFYYAADKRPIAPNSHETFTIKLQPAPNGQKPLPITVTNSAGDNQRSVNIDALAPNRHLPSASLNIVHKPAGGLGLSAKNVGTDIIGLPDSPMPLRPHSFEGGNIYKLSEDISVISFDNTPVSLAGKALPGARLANSGPGR